MRRDPHRLALVEHLVELRRRLLVVVLLLIAATGAAYWLRAPLAGFLTGIAPVAELIYIAPAEFFLTQLRIAVLFGLLTVIPVLFWQLWAFVRPGLTRTEAAGARGFLIAAIPLFYIGLAFALFVMAPFVLNFLLGQATGRITAQLSYGSYVSFILSLSLAFAVAFELPVFVVTLVRIGIVSPRTLSRFRGVVLIALLLLSALITPPDIVSMVIVAAPLIVLFEASLLVARIGARRREAERNQE